MTAMDGRGTPSDPLVINTGLDLGKHFHPDGTPRRRDGSARRSRQTDQTTVTDIGGDRVDDASGAAAKTAAYNEMVADLQDAWKTPEQRAHTQRVTADATPPQGVTAADWAREQGIREMSDAWKPRDAAVPKILPVGAWPDTVQTEGASCSVDGALGTWTRGSDGYLYCRPKAMAATRADASVGTRDAVDQAWRAMVEEQANAWRS
jgi:hypothetical protein